MSGGLFERRARAGTKETSGLGGGCPMRSQSGNGDGCTIHGRTRHIKRKASILAAATVAALNGTGLFSGNVARAGNTWTGGGASTNWSDNDNWGGAQPGYGTLTFTTGGGQ